MTLDDQICYRALAARDVRFDGLFFVGVTTTGIYCRPVCTARTPGRDRCRFFPNAAMAERAGFRPCLRCRPELAPGHAPIDAVGRTARQAAAQIEAGALNEGGSLEQLARELGLSTRQLRRGIRKEFGVSPVQLAQTNRLLLAKQLLTESQLPIIDVALASGFSSVRRFNALFRNHYGFTPTTMRRSNRCAPEHDSLRLTLAYRPPFAWSQLLSFLAKRAAPGVECVMHDAYVRTVALGAARGWVRVGPIPDRNALAVDLSISLMPVLPELLSRLRHAFDLSARPDVIASHLSGDTRLARSIRRFPGLRVAGAFDGFELAIRAILGQRVSVAAATTLASRLAHSCGEPVATPFPCLNRLSPAAERLERVDLSEFTRLGIPVARGRVVRELASAVSRKFIRLEPGVEPERTIAQLVELPGLGDWTAQYIAMRALRWPDAFPAGDLGLLRALGMASSTALRKTAEAWRPWRAYAAMHLWNIVSHNEGSKS
jgi:AraC family transcriptional regulator of adaptative response / DNA-3-methyladenine glycosylase II